MHRPILLLVTALLGVASLLFTGLAMSIPEHPARANDSVSADQTVRRFYDAVNLHIRTGDASALRDVLHENFADEHPLPGFAQGAESLIEHVAVLHTGMPTIEIAVESIVANGDEVFASVSVRNAGRGSGFESASPVWAAMERFRIEGGRIIERSSSHRNLIVVEERFDLPLVLEAGAQDAFLATLWRFEASGSTRFQTSGGPAALHVLTGELAITVVSNAGTSGTQAPVVHEPGSEGSKPDPVDDVVRLQQGSTMTVPGGTGFAVTASDSAASALYVSREAMSPLGPGSDAQSDESAGAEARDLGVVPFGPRSEPSLSTRLHRIVLMPGALVTNPTLPAMLWLETGTVLTEHSRPPRSGAGTVNTNRPFVGGVQLSPDDGLAYGWEPGATLHNTGSEAAVVWALTVEAVESAMPS